MNNDKPGRSSSPGRAVRAAETAGKAAARPSRRAGSLHEDLRREHKVENGSDRAFGLTVGGILLVIAAWRAWGYGPGVLPGILGAIGGALVLAGFEAPHLLKPLNRLWFRFGLLLGKVVAPVAMTVIFVTTIVPIGLLMRAKGGDPLRLKRSEEAPSYWIPKDPPGPDPRTMTNQF